VPIVAIGNDALWIKFCEVVGREDLAQDVRFKTNPLRTENIGALIPILGEILMGKTTREWSEIFERADLPYSPINSIKDICDDPHIRHRKMLVEIDQPVAGKMRIAGSPIRLSETPGDVYAPAPLLGQHSEEVLRNILKYGQDDIDRLKQEGVINLDSPSHFS
jgi:CoA:oxalate CoA-transferase